jgi:hypothetical protein
MKVPVLAFTTSQIAMNDRQQGRMTELGTKNVV